MSRQENKSYTANTSRGAARNYSDKAAKSAQKYDENLLINGRIEGNAKGFGFFVPEDGSEDMFVGARDMCGAMHGDKVRAIVVSHNRGAGEARVVEIVERGYTKIVGLFQMGSSGGGFMVPDDNHIASDIHIASSLVNGAKNGEKVVVEITSYPDGRKPEGKIVEVLGKPEDIGVDILSIIRAYNLYQEFPRNVLADAKNVPQFVSAAEISARKDYRDECVVTIDGDDSKDFDDAVSLSRRANGDWRLAVHIADVSQYVKPVTLLDKEALKRATSVYFVDRVLPMLPVELSNGICSLNEGEDRLTLSVIMDIDACGHVVKHRIREGVIRSKARLTYSKVASILDGDEALRREYASLVPMLEDMKLLADALNAKRTERGNIEFDLPESKIELDENGKVCNICFLERLVSHKIIEEFMLVTNETVAEHFVGLKCPFVYRAHAAPPIEKVESLVNFLSALGISFKGNINDPKPKDFSAMLSTVAEKFKGVVNKVALRSMTKATYEPVNIGHFGLAAPFYCHFTSPIRRYPDLMIHRIIKDYLNNGAKCFSKYENIVAEVSKVSSERERLAEQAERKVDDLKKAEYMKDKIGEKFDGTISGVTEWGIFVELGNSVEGLVRAENLPGGDYVYNADFCRLDNSKYTFKLGDAVSIIVSAVVGDRVSFTLDMDKTKEK